MRRFFSLKRILVLTTLLFLAFSLQAGLVTIEWSWSAADDDITTFRYRLNNQGWVVVDSSVTSFVLEGVDENNAYTFEIQQSYDGKLFSGSSSYAYPAGTMVVDAGETVPAVTEGTETAMIDTVPSTEVIDAAPVSDVIIMDEPIESAVIMDAPIESAIIMDEPIDSAIIMDAPIDSALVMDEPIAAGDELVFADEFTVAEDTIDTTVAADATATADAIAQPTTAPSGVTPLTPPTEQELIEALDSNPQMAVELFLGAGGKGDNVFLQSVFDPDGAYTPLRTMILPSFTFDFVYPGIVTYSPDSYLSARAGFGFSLYEGAGQKVVAPDVRAGVSYTRRFGDKWSVDGVLGLSFMFTGSGSTVTTPSATYGPYVAVIGRYDISDVLSVAAMAETRFLMSDLFTPYELTGIVRVGLTYRF